MNRLQFLGGLFGLGVVAKAKPALKEANTTGWDPYWINRLEQKLDAMKPGDILISGVRDNRGAITRQVIEDIKTNASLGKKRRRSMGEL